MWSGSACRSTGCCVIGWNGGGPVWAKRRTEESSTSRPKHAGTFIKNLHSLGRSEGIRRTVNIAVTVVTTCWNGQREEELSHGLKHQHLKGELLCRKSKRAKSVAGGLHSLAQRTAQKNCHTAQRVLVAVNRTMSCGRVAAHSPTLSP